MNNEILNGLRGENNTAFGELYRKYFGMVSRLVFSNHGQADDAEDIFQDTMLVYWKSSVRMVLHLLPR